MIRIILISFVLDLIFGDPEWLPHPVRWIGRLITFFDEKLRGRGSVWNERSKGILLAVNVIGITVLAAYLVFALLRHLHPILGDFFLIYVGYSVLAITDLRVKAKAVGRALLFGNVTAARTRLACIVGRDTAELDEERITIATLETIAESTSDGIIAPLFYMFIGGPILALAYKAVNTLDSMVGYKDEKYLHFGWFSARLDDVLNYIPSRICGLLIAAAAYLTDRTYPHALDVMLKDGANHDSPNSGVVEAAMAGALGVQFGGPWQYQGEVVSKPFIGQSIVPVRPYLINQALTVSLIASLLMLAAGVMILWIM